MSMVKENLTNIKKLIKHSLNEDKNILKFIVLIYGLLSLLNITFPIIITNLTSNEPEYISANSMGNGVHFIFFITTIVGLALFSNWSKKISIFPTTQMTKAITYNLSYAIAMLSFLVLYTAIYSLTYLAMFIYSMVNENVVLTVEFNLGYSLFGIVVNIINALILYSLINIFVAFIRKFGAYGWITLATITVILISNFQPVINYLNRLLELYFAEDRIFSYFVRSIIILIVFNLIAYTIYYFTKEYKTKIYKKLEVIIFVGICFTITSLSILFIEVEEVYYLQEDYNGVELTHDWEVDGYYDITDRFDSYVTLEFDISHLEENSVINIITNENVINEEKFEEQIFNDNFIWSDLVLPTNEVTVTGDTLLLSYRLPIKITNNVDILSYAKPTVEAELIGNELHINYQYNKDLILISILPISMLFEFDVFEGKNIQTSLFQSSSSNSTGLFSIETK